MATKLISNNFTPPSSPLVSATSSPRTSLAFSAASPKLPFSPSRLSNISPLATPANTSIVLKALFSSATLKPPHTLPTRRTLFSDESTLSDESLALSKVSRKRKRSLADDKVRAVQERSLFGREKFRPNLPPSSSSSPVSLPKPIGSIFGTEGQIREMGSQRLRYAPPEAPVKKRAPRSYLNKGQAELEQQKQIEFNSYINPSIIRDKNLTPLKTNDPEGQYKTPWLDPTDTSKIVLTFKENQLNNSAKIISEHMKSSMEQYNQLKAIDQLTHNCVTIYNAETALEDKYFIVERIHNSFVDVLIDLKDKGLTPFESMQQLNGPLDGNQTIALGLLSQIKDFYNLSIEHGIDTDLHIGNFRVKNNQLILTDFRESIEEGDLMPNKLKEFHEFQRDLGSIFKPKFLDEYFDFPDRPLIEE